MKYTEGEARTSVRSSASGVTGICVGKALRAYPFTDMAPTAVINDNLGGQALLVIFDLDSRTAIPYSRIVEGQELTFYQVEAEGDLPVEFMDRGDAQPLGHARLRRLRPSRGGEAGTVAGVQLDVVRLEYVLAGDDDMGDR